MRTIMLLILAAAVVVPPINAQSKKPPQKYDPPARLTPSEETLEKISTGVAKLATKIAELRRRKDNAPLLPDVEIFRRGAENMVRFSEFFDKSSAPWTLECIELGLQRADELLQGKPTWTNAAGKNVVRGYRSLVDDTAQPYGVTYPHEYGKDPAKAWRVDVVLHGRNAGLTEVSFLHAHNGSRKVAANQDYVQIDIFGRGNNAYRWAGETDVLEAVEAFFQGESQAGRGKLIDRRRVVLRGFSMGGAGAWHLGLHHPSKWCVMGPGAGFTTTHGYVGGLPNPLPDYQERCLRIYDALDYAENAANIPIVAYSGGDDPQKLAADNIEKRLKELDIHTMTHLVAPGLGHTFPAPWFKKANALWAEHAAKGRADYPKQIDFVTYTLKYPTCDWITITGLEKHYDKATVKAERADKGFRIATKNVQGLRIELPADAPKSESCVVLIDDQKITVKPGSSGPRSAINLVNDGGWKLADASKSTSRKRSGLQGPIDDAFSQAFVCVIGSGDTWHPATQKYLDAKLDAFRQDWAKHWRGELPTTGDYAVNPNDIMDKNLILFGDPHSNLTLAQIMPKLPFTWTADAIELAGVKYKVAEHIPVLIFPNPLNPRRYVVLNTGPTIPSADYTKTNALLYPRLGDYAILRPTTGSAFEIASVGLFNELWQLESK